MPGIQHKINRIGWLRAAVLGANDGIVSTSSLLLGVAAANTSHENVLLAGVAGLVAGAMSMATGEYVSVSSQADTEKAALTEEQGEIQDDFSGEEQELASIYVKRGLDSTLAEQVADELMSQDPLAAHAREELGITEISSANPLQAAFSSALSFSVGAIFPLIVAVIAGGKFAVPAIAISALISLAILGAISARAVGAPVTPAIIRITFWSTLAMGVSAGVGALFGHVTGL